MLLLMITIWRLRILMKENRKRKLRVIVVFFLLFTLFGCSSYGTLSPMLPDFALDRPIRPTLVELDDNLQLPLPIAQNNILLIGYIEELEAYSDGWERFYNDLREEYTK